MIIKQIAIDEALELHKRGLMVGVLQPVVPEPKNLDDYEFLTLKKILEGCEFFRIVLEEEKRETEPAEKEQSRRLWKRSQLRQVRKLRRSRSHQSQKQQTKSRSMLEE